MLVRWKLLRFRAELEDCLFLLFSVWVSAALYLWWLGFYSDDWAFLGTLTLSDDQSLPGLIRTFFTEKPDDWVRPVKGLYHVVLYSLFGLQPLGFHLVNTTVLMLGVVLFYLVLRELNQNRYLALALPLVYGLLPHYSTDRFWYAASQANLSMALYFLNLYCDLRTLRAGSRFLWGWKALALASLLGSCLAYEVFMPLFILNAVIVLGQTRRMRSSWPVSSAVSPGKLALVFGGGNLLSLLLVVSFKKLVSERARAFGFPGIMLFIRAPLDVTYDDYGIGLPRVLWRILRLYPNPVVLASAGVLALLVFSYLYRMPGSLEAEPLKGSRMLILIVGGLAVSALTYAFLYGTGWSAPAPPRARVSAPTYAFLIGTAGTGINNRTVIAAAIGVACSIVGWLGWSSSLLAPRELRVRVFYILIAVVCAIGFLINNVIATFWIAASRRQQTILADIRQHFPSLPPRTTLLLDGFCPYIGPGIVFETSWDVSGALQIIYGDRTLKGDVVKPNTRVGDDGISTFIYALKKRYPYQNLLVYNVRRKSSYPLTDAKTARTLFAGFKTDSTSSCPTGREGYGAEIFKTD